MVVKCTICGRSLRTQYNLNIHMAVHTGEKCHNCAVCGKSFQQHWNLVTHVSRVHAGHRPFRCDDCGRTFGYKTHFKAHVRSHFLAQIEVPAPIKDRLLHPYTCTICSKSFETSSLVKQHEETHFNTKTFICDDCNKTFSTKRNIRNHIQNSCHGARGENLKPKQIRKEPTPCEICGKNVARYSMHKHMNIHTRRRIYPCGICGRQFLEAGQKEIHERTHSGHKPHKCQICSKAFTQIGNLNVHNRRFHNQSEKINNKREKIVAIEKIPIINNLENMELILEIDNLTEETVNETIELNNTILCNKELENTIEKSAVPIENQQKTGFGVSTIHEFVQLASNWITTRNQIETDENQTNEKWTKRAKLEIWNKLVGEIGDDEIIKNVIKNFRDIQKDNTIRLLKKIDNLPNNSVVIQNGKHNWKWRCWDCSAIMNSRHLLLRHRLRHMPSHLLPHRCKICSKTFSQTGNLKHHMMVHKGEHCFTCEHCGALFRHKSHLKTHSQQHSKDKRDQKYHCAICGKSTNTRAHLIQHIRTHTLEKPYQCQTCGKRFTASSTYDRHMKIHTSMRIKCLVCGQEFSDISGLRRHEAIHDAQKRHTCTCGRSFTQKSSLRRHKPICEKSVDPPAKTFKCPACLKCFIDSTALKRHTATHNVEKTFPCIHCSLLLKTRETLHRHIRRMHGDLKT